MGQFSNVRGGITFTVQGHTGDGEKGSLCTTTPGDIESGVCTPGA